MLVSGKEMALSFVFLQIWSRLRDTVNNGFSRVIFISTKEGMIFSNLSIYRYKALHHIFYLQSRKHEKLQCCFFLHIKGFLFLLFFIYGSITSNTIITCFINIDEITHSMSISWMWLKGHRENLAQCITKFSLMKRKKAHSFSRKSKQTVRF